MKKLFSRSVLSLLVVVSASASAGSNTGFTPVAQLAYATSGIVQVRFPVASVTGIPACAGNVGNEYTFVFDATTVAGKAMLAGFLEAHSTGIPVWVFGTGTCNGGFESVANFSTQN
jgi:hypothetical protein